MLFGGITGGIGSGKSTVARIFEAIGIPVYYADAAAKKLMNEEEHIRQSIIQSFGPDSYSGKILNRKFLAEKVFQNDEKLSILNGIIHPATIADATKWRSEQQAPYALKEAAILFESGSYKDLDFIIGVSAPEEIRIQRTINRDQISRKEVLDRIHKQMNEDEKMRRCDYILINDESTPLLSQVLKLHTELLQLTERSTL